MKCTDSRWSNHFLKMLIIAHFVFLVIQFVVQGFFLCSFLCTWGLDAQWRVWLFQSIVVLRRVCLWHEGISFGWWFHRVFWLAEFLSGLPVVILGHWFLFGQIFVRSPRNQFLLGQRWFMYRARSSFCHWSRSRFQHRILNWSCRVFPCIERPRWWGHVLDVFLAIINYLTFLCLDRLRRLIIIRQRSLILLWVQILIWFLNLQFVEITVRTLWFHTEIMLLLFIWLINLIWIWWIICFIIEWAIAQ